MMYPLSTVSTKPPSHTRRYGGDDCRAADESEPGVHPSYSCRGGGHAADASYFCVSTANTSQFDIKASHHFFGVLSTLRRMNETTSSRMPSAKSESGTCAVMTTETSPVPSSAVSKHR